MPPVKPLVKKEIATVTKKPTDAPAKPPTKEFKMNTHYIQYYGKELLKFEGDEVQNNYSFALIKCKDT
jgi:hypothetical protein